MVVECSLSLPVRLYLEHFLHMNTGKITDGFVWLDMILVPLGCWNIVFGSEVVYTLSCRCTSLPMTVFGVIVPILYVEDEIIMMSTYLAR